MLFSAIEQLIYLRNTFTLCETLEFNSRLLLLNRITIPSSRFVNDGVDLIAFFRTMARHFFQNAQLIDIQSKNTQQYTICVGTIGIQITTLFHRKIKRKKQKWESVSKQKLTKAKKSFAFGSEVWYFFSIAKYDVRNIGKAMKLKKPSSVNRTRNSTRTPHRKKISFLSKLWAYIRKRIYINPYDTYIIARYEHIKCMYKCMKQAWLVSVTDHTCYGWRFVRLSVIREMKSFTQRRQQSAIPINIFIHL